MRVFSLFGILALTLVFMGGGKPIINSQTGGVESLEPWNSNTDPTDVPKQHVEEISTSAHRYVIIQGGTMDGENCRTPHGSWNPMVQTWESNRSVRIENIGDTDLVNPWL